MVSKKLFKQLATLVIAIFVLNFLANKFHWYYSIWWFDMLMHFLGGFWLGMVFVWFFKVRQREFSVNPRFVIRLVAWILLIGVAWELFEYYFINYVAQNNFDLLDTLSDLFFDLFGGILSGAGLSSGIINSNKVEL
jgi:hypothetical protein